MKNYPQSVKNSYIVEYLNSNLSQAEFCKKYNINKGTFNNWCTNLGIYQNQEKKTKYEMMEHLLEQKKSNLSISEYCRRKGIIRTTFNNWKKRILK